MQTYITLYTCARQARCTGDAHRGEEMRATAERMGGRVRALYWTHGRYEAVAVEEWPDEDAAMAFTMILAQDGGVRSETLHAFTDAAIRRIGAEWPACIHRAAAQAHATAAHGDAAEGDVATRNAAQPGQAVESPGQQRQAVADGARAPAPEEILMSPDDEAARYRTAAALGRIQARGARRAYMMAGEG